LNNNGLEEEGVERDSSCLHVLIYTDARCSGFNANHYFNGQYYTSSELATLLEQQYGAIVSVVHYNNYTNGNVNNDISDCEGAQDVVSDDGIYVESDFDCESQTGVLDSLGFRDDIMVSTRHSDFKFEDDNIEPADKSLGSIKERLLIYPNPTEGLFAVEHSFEKDLVLQVMKIDGAMLLEQEIKIGEQVAKIDLSEMLGGTYIVQLKERDTGQILVSRKLIKL